MRNLKDRIAALALSSAIVLASAASSASAATVETFGGLGMMMDAWDVEFNGNVNSFVVVGDCDDKGGAVAANPEEGIRRNNGNVSHGLACGSSDDDSYSDIRTGLLPAWFDFIASTKAGGWTTKVHISFQPGGDSGPSALTGGNSIDGPLGLNTANFRQVYTSLSHDEIGTFKIGRDLGVFGSNAILEDMTLLGVGAPGASGGGNTTLGRIGFGYIYADWKAQLQYTTPTVKGLSATFALVDPWGASSLAGFADDTHPGFVRIISTTHDTTRTQDNNTFGFETKLNYAFEVGGVSGHLWASYVNQDIDWESSCLNGWEERGGRCVVEVTGEDDEPELITEEFRNDDAEVEAYDYGAKLVAGDFDFVVYSYRGVGVGTTGFLVDALDGFGKERDTDGYYVQARWRAPAGTVLGVSYGESNLDETDWDKRTAQDDEVRNFNLVETNSLFVLGAYHPVGEGMNLVAELSRVKSQAHNGNDGEEDVLAVGAIMFF